METLFALLPIVLVLVGFALAALFWAIKSGQFDDLEGPAYRILHDDDDPRIPFNRQGEKEGERAEDGGEEGQRDKDRPAGS
ncbi:MAG: cbb3-type cytochrome oxidase assembly protein CcoS [Thiohalorhabdus sp.]|uniref:cbb3-type cytochrome oxidase assembly protein CcoS n=1 Tax=Thiohalorhabdus sp. TaxID=3094134 RepID=UPI0039805345